MESTQGRRNLEGGPPPQDWGTNLIGEVMVKAHWTVDMFTGLARPELVHTHCTARDNPPGNRWAEAGGWVLRRNQCTTAGMSPEALGNHGGTVIENSLLECKQTRLETIHRKNQCPCKYETWNTPKSTLGGSKQGSHQVQARLARLLRDYIL